MRYGFALLATCSAAAVMAGAAQAAEMDRMVAFDIPAQSLDTALLVYSRQSGIQVISSSSVLVDKRAPRVRANATPLAALSALLDGSQLSFRVAGAGTVAIVEAGPPASRPAPGFVRTQGAAAVPSPAPSPPVTLAAAETVEPEAVEQIIVTGSRIARRDYTSPTPIVTATEQVIQQGGISNVEQALNVMPQFVPAGDATATGRGAAGQRATLNLRGLGTNRNLVLLDGRRLPFSSATGVTDVNIIPSALIQGVEAITGGASAVYGSDAMSGVVNFQTRRNFEGLQIDSQYGNTFDSDRQTREVNVTAGGRFMDDRGSAVLSVGYSDRERLHGSERSHTTFGTPSGFIGAGAYIPTASNLPSQAALNAVFNRYDNRGGNVPRSGGPANIGFNDDGTLFLINSARNYRGPTTGEYFILDGQVRHPFQPTLDITSAQERRWAFGKFSYELKPGLEAYTQVLYVNSETDQDDGTTLTQYGTLNTIPVTNPFIPADLRAILASRPNPNAPFEWNSRYVGVPHKGFNDSYGVTQLIFGLRGDVGVRDWTFDIYASSDDTDSTQTVRNAVVKEPVQRLWNAPDGGRSLCAGGFNPFGDANAKTLSAECIDFITATLHHSQSIKQDIVEASVQGTLFNLPAGELRFSVVGGTRKQEYAYTPDSRIRELGAIEAISAQAATAGTLKADEISGELLIPVLRDLPFVKSLNIGTAYRYSHYNYAGGNSTYKIDGDWTVVEGLLIRGGYARAVRAPNMAESFFDRQSSPAPIGTPPTGGEPCDIRTTARQQGGAALRALCVATGVPEGIVDGLIVPTSSAGNSITSGNPNLSPESADTFTAGVVLRPTVGPDFLQRLSISLDFYDIKISEVIGTIAAPTVLNACYNQNGLNPSYSASNEYCQLLHRDPNGILFMVDTPYLNLGGLHVRGLDFNLDWRQQVGPGMLTFGTMVGYKLKDRTKDFANSPWVELVGTGARYRWQTVTNLGYAVGAVQAGVRFRYTSAQKDPTWVTRPASPAPGVRPFYAFDVNASWQINDKVQLRGGINNLWQPSAPLPNSLVAQTNGALWDAVGRAYYLAIRAKL
jgi:outer membrane receptor protein involved in Fe transport